MSWGSNDVLTESVDGIRYEMTTTVSDDADKDMTNTQHVLLLYAGTKECIDRNHKVGTSSTQ